MELKEKLSLAEDRVLHLTKENNELQANTTALKNELIELNSEILAFREIFDAKRVLESRNMELKTALDNLKWGFEAR